MPILKNPRRNEEKNRRGALAEKSSSFHGRSPMVATASAAAPQLLRPKTVPELASWKGLAHDSRPKLPKLLLKVTIQGSLGPVQVVMTPESAVGDLVAAAVRQYVKEARRPILRTGDPSAYDLHYSQFSLESLGRGERLVDLGSRNFFLILRKAAGPSLDSRASPELPPSCSGQAERISKIGLPLLKFMDFLL